jgi:hypothetical protein
MRAAVASRRETNMRRNKAGFAPLAAAIAAVIAFTLAALAMPPVTARQSRGSGQKSRINLPPEFMGVAGIPGWVLAGTPRTFAREGLSGYIGAGSEIFLDYGFRNLSVFVLVPEKPAAVKKAITLEIYRMDSPASAFGVFSMRRKGGERTSPKIKTIHWIGPEQANMVMGDFYINVIATGCTPAEVEDFAASLAAGLPSKASSLPDEFASMPEFSLVPGTERYIRGAGAAAQVSPLLGADFWGFKANLAEAYSARYGPLSSKLILIHFKQPPDDLAGEVLKLFGQHATEVSMSDNIIRGANAVSGNMYFGLSGQTGILVIGEPDVRAARALILQALNKAAKKFAKKPGKGPRAAD